MMARHRKLLSTLGKVLVAVLCLVLARDSFEKDVFLEFLKNPSLCLIFVAMWVANQFLVSWRLDLLFTKVGCRIPYLSLVRSTFVSLLFTSVLPGVVGADLAKIVLIKNVNPERGLTLIGSGILLDRALGLATLIIVSVLASFFLPLNTLNQAQLRVVYATWLLGALLVLGWLTAMTFQRWFIRQDIGAHTPGYRFKIVRRGFEMIRLWRLPITAQLHVFSVSLLAIGIIVLVQALVTGWLFESRSLPFNFALTMFIFPALTIISALPITPLGLGVGQLAVGSAFRLFGLPTEIGVAVATLSQLTLGVVSLLFGGVIFWLNRSKHPVESPQPFEAEMR